MVFKNIVIMHDDDNVDRCPFCGSTLLNNDENKLSEPQKPANESYSVSRKEIGRRMMGDRGEERFHQLVEALKDFKLSR